MMQYIMSVTAVFVMSCSDPHSAAQLKSLSSESIFATGLYLDQSPNLLSAEARNYKPSEELWSDGAAKKRWVSLPADSTIDTTDANHWVFPVGTKFWKEFSHLGKKIETRYIEKISTGSDAASWSFTTYQWNDDGTDALRAPNGGVKDAAPTASGVTHDIPSTTQCLQCHRTGAEPVLGFDMLLLNGDGEGLRSQELVDMQLASPVFETNKDILSDNAATRSALKYLHVNCGNCHNPDGRAGRMTGLYFKHDMTVTTIEQSPSHVTAVNTLTQYYEVPGQTQGKDSFNIKPHEPEQSAVYVRMEQRGAAVSMPPLGSKIPDEIGLNLIKNWILSL